MARVLQYGIAKPSLGGAVVALLLSSCTLPGTQSAARTGRIGTGVAAVPAPPKLTVTPADQAAHVALDAPVIVKSSSGRIDSVSIQEAGVDSPPNGVLSADGRLWRLTDALDPGAHYTIDVNASSAPGAITTAHSAFTTLTAATRLLTSWSPDDGSLVGVGEPIYLRFNTAIPAERRAALLQRIHVTSTPGTVGAWHWWADDTVHFRTKGYWPAGAHVTITGNLKGFDAGNGVWGLGDWTTSFSVGDKHVSIIDDNTHQMQVFNNDQLIDTYPVSMGKAGFTTIQGTLIILYKTYQVRMDSCSTFGGAACIPGGANYYSDFVYYDTAVSSTGYYIHSAPWSVWAQGRYDVSHGCINLSPEHAVTFYNYSRTGDVVIVKNTGYNATADDGEGDWQIDFGQFSNTTGMGAVWTGTPSSSLSGRVS